MLDDLNRPPTWHERAACRSHPDPELWSYKISYNYDDERDLQLLRIIEALEICDTCPVRNECLAQGLEEENMVPGIIWGGLLTYERIKLKKNTKARSYKNEWMIINKARRILKKGAR